MASRESAETRSLPAILREAARRTLARRLRRSRVSPAVGRVRFGGLRRLTPVSRLFGFDRGQPIDRYYIEAFLARYSGGGWYGEGDLHGHALEIADDRYARKFGGWGTPQSKIHKLDILHVNSANEEATIVADLTSADHIPSDTFDCIICTQTLLLIYDVRAAIATLHRILKPGGVLLATFPGISRICRPEIDLWGDYWRFTTRSARRLFEEIFPANGVSVEAYGNVLTAIAFLHGLAVEDLKSRELELHDPDYEVLISVRAVK
jgi:SAM-dependent methyltransferase